MNPEIRIIGSGNKDSYPKTNCFCPICSDARINPANRRIGSSAILINQEILIDCGIGVYEQIQKLKSNIKHIIITRIEEQNDLDIFYLADKNILVHVPESLKNNFKSLRLKVIPYKSKILFKDLIFRIKKTGTSFAVAIQDWLYCPDWSDFKSVKKALTETLCKKIIGDGSNLLETKDPQFVLKGKITDLQKKYNVNKIVFLSLGHKNHYSDSTLYSILLNSFSIPVSLGKDLELIT